MSENNLNSRVTKKVSREPREEFEVIIKDVRKSLKNLYKFNISLNGSAKFNCITRDINGSFDIDYQMILTKNCKSSSYPKDTTNVRNEIFNAFKENVPKDYRLEASKSVITLIKVRSGERLWSYDICILKELNSIDLCYLGRNSNGNDGGNSYTWCPLKNYLESFEKFKSLDFKEKVWLIEEKILPRKIKMKKIEENNPLWRSSIQVFVEEVNNFVSN